VARSVGRLGWSCVLFLLFSLCLFAYVCVRFLCVFWAAFVALYCFLPWLRWLRPFWLGLPVLVPVLLCVYQCKQVPLLAPVLLHAQRSTAATSRTSGLRTCWPPLRPRSKVPNSGLAFTPVHADQLPSGWTPCPPPSLLPCPTRTSSHPLASAWACRPGRRTPPPSGATAGPPSSRVTPITLSPAPASPCSGRRTTTLLWQVGAVSLLGRVSTPQRSPPSAFSPPSPLLDPRSPPLREAALLASRCVSWTPLRWPRRLLRRWGPLPLPEPSWCPPSPRPRDPGECHVRVPTPACGG
jgi:hypothetical protein